MAFFIVFFIVVFSLGLLEGGKYLWNGLKAKPEPEDKFKIWLQNVEYFVRKEGKNKAYPKDETSARASFYSGTTPRDYAIQIISRYH